RAALRRGAEQRPDRRGRAEAARAAARRDLAGRARGRRPLPRQAPLGHRLSGEGHQGRGVARGETLVIRLAAALALFIVALAQPAGAASKIEPIVSPGGIKAWIVREPSVPVVAMDFAFGGGADADPADKPGVGNMVSAMLDEGAGDLDARAFQERLEERAIQINFSSGRDHFRG